jgi:hypothetical protein
MGDNARLHDHEKLIAADEINNIKHLRMKMQYGQENTAIDVSSDNPLPVSGNVTLSGGTITQITAPAATADPRTGVTDAIRAAASVNNPRSRRTPD